MKYFQNVKAMAAGAALLVSVAACESLIEDESLRNNPNAPTPEQIDPNFLLNSIQTALPGFFNGVQTTGAELVRQRYMFGSTYEVAYNAQSFSGTWSTGYATIATDVKALIPVAMENRLYTHAAIAYIARAYVFATMADVFGDIPYEQAVKGDQGSSFFNPEISSASTVYAGAMADLDSAIVNLARTERAQPVNDLYFGDLANTNAKKDAWRRLANTLKLRMAITSNNTAVRDAIMANRDANLLLAAPTASFAARSNASFRFRFGTSTANPDSRHPSYVANYLNQAGTYMANSFMFMLLRDKSVVDPRIRYYFFRQALSPSTNPVEQNCIGSAAPQHHVTFYTGFGYTLADIPFCQLPDGYWGRDHGNAEGIPPDGRLRTAFGVYPIGGAFDGGVAGGAAQRADLTPGLAGAGIHPIWMHFFTDFLLAEHYANAGDDVNAKLYLERGMRSSIQYVMDFGAAAVGGATARVPSAGDVTAYVTEVLADYDAASGAAAKAGVTLKEYYIALWGNGYEAYNNYRRTTYPREIQPHIRSNPGKFYRSFLYPATYLQLNSNAPGQKADNAVRVFWDTEKPSYNFNF